MSKKILVTGGAGFIGSHTCIELLNNGNEVVVVDNLYNANKKSLEVVERVTGKKVTFYEVDVRDEDKLNEVFEKEGNIYGVIHYAGLKAVGESCETAIAEMTVKVDAVISNASPIKIAETLKAKATNVLIVLPMKRKMDLSSATKGINKSEGRSSNRPFFI